MHGSESLGLSDKVLPIRMIPARPFSIRDHVSIVSFYRMSELVHSHRASRITILDYKIIHVARHCFSCALKTDEGQSSFKVFLAKFSSLLQQSMILITLGLLQEEVGPFPTAHFLTN